VAYVLPGLKDRFEDWWKALINQAFFAPVYMLLTWVTLTFSNNSLCFIRLVGGFTGVVDSSASTYGPDSPRHRPELRYSNRFPHCHSHDLNRCLKKRARREKLTGKALGFAGDARWVLRAEWVGTIGRLGAGVASSETVKNMVASNNVLAQSSW